MPAIIRTKPWTLALTLVFCATAALVLMVFRPASASLDGRAYWDPADSDADGMSDAWEVSCFGSISARSGGEDDDLDDLTTYDEWAAKSDPFKLDPKAIGEVGTLIVSQPDGQYWHKVRTEGVYQNPVVVVGPAERGGWNTPLITRVRNVEAQSFEFQLDRFEYDLGDWENANIGVSWLVVEEGRSVLGNGLAIEAGNSPVDSQGIIHGSAAALYSFTARSAAPVTVGDGISVSNVSYAPFTGQTGTATQLGISSGAGAAFVRSTATGANTDQGDDLADAIANEAYLKFTITAGVEDLPLRSLSWSHWATNPDATSECRIYALRQGVGFNVGDEIGLTQTSAANVTASTAVTSGSLDMTGTIPAGQTEEFRFYFVDNDSRQTLIHYLDDIVVNDRFFSAPFATTPVVLADSVTFNGTYATETRVYDVTPLGFQVVLQNEESKQPHEMTETVSWVAIEPGFLQDEFGRRQAGLFEGVDSTYQKFTFPEREWSTPAFFANVQTLNGSDTVTLRYRNLTDRSVELKLFEDQSQDQETTHLPETVGYFIPKHRGMFHVLPTTGDQDADGLPDAWEAANGLAGGSGDTKGYYGDFDNDGLTNGEEYLAGTHADLADSDGDGISDYEEVNFYHSDALASDVTEFSPLFSVGGSAFETKWGSWMRDGTRAYQTSPRGWVEYQIEIAAPGVHAVEVAVSPRAGGGASSRYEMVVSIDGAFVSREAVIMGESGSGTATVITPWLDSGAHTVRVLVDNSYVNRRINVDSLTVLGATGVDSNSNGLPDWTEIRIRRQNRGNPESCQSFTAAFHRSASKGMPAFWNSQTRWSPMIPALPSS